MEVELPCLRIREGVRVFAGHIEQPRGPIRGIHKQGVGGQEHGGTCGALGVRVVAVLLRLAPHASGLHIWRRDYTREGESLDLSRGGQV